MAPSPQAIEAAALQDDYCRVITPENLLTDETEEVCVCVFVEHVLLNLGEGGHPRGPRSRE